MKEAIGSGNKRDKQFTQQNIYSLVQSYKPQGLIKFRNLTGSKYEMYLQPSRIIGHASMVLIQTWMNEKKENFGSPPYLQKALDALTIALDNRSVVLATCDELFNWLFEIWGPLEIEQPWEPLAQTVCEKLVCALYANEFISHTLSL